MIKQYEQPSGLKVLKHGVAFRSPLDGTKLFLGPKESMVIQTKLGADIMFAFDECTPPAASKVYTRQSLIRTHEWAVASLDHRNRNQAIFGIVQGGKYRDLRMQSAQFIGSLPFDGFGIGGEFGSEKKTMTAMISRVVEHLPAEKPRHLLGIGHPEDMVKIIRAGIDTFDCIAPTHYARHGTAFTSQGRINIGTAAFRRDKKPLDTQCGCSVCQHYTRSYLCHLFRAREITGMVLLTMHNLWFFNTLVEKIRNDIQYGKL
jgi:tRNA-guanine family transglycosylase